MKKVLFIILMVLGCFTLMLKTKTFAAGITSIVNTPHNLNTTDYGIVVQNGEVCRPCHTAHFADKLTPNYRLWNHNVDITKSYTLYGTSSGYVGLDTASRLCLSCHDGSIAVDAYGSSNGPSGSVGAGSHFMEPDNQIGAGGDLKKDHPVGVLYAGWDGTAYAVGGRLVDPSTWTGTTKPSLKKTSVTGQYIVGCTTCHSAHNSAAAYGKFLRVDNTGSALCLMCHAK